mgnify:CR=1 FL=1
MLDYKVIVHYHNPKGDYFSYDLWQWQTDQWGKEAPFSKLDYFGIQGELSFESWEPLGQAHVIVKRSDWSSQSCDYHIDLLPVYLPTEVWLIEGDHQVYYSLQAATTSHQYSRRRPHNFDVAMRSDYFDECWGYEGWLGHRLQGHINEFKVWAPTAKKVELLVYETSDNQAAVYKEFSMEKGEIYSHDHAKNTIGVWSVEVPEDLAGKAYQYHVHFENQHFLTRDPYTIATSPDGKRSAIVAEQDKTVAGFKVCQGKEATWRLDNPNQTVIYEMHIRDISKSPSSGVAEHLRGTFLGACQSGTRNSQGDQTTFDYIRNLGINVVQLQPVSDRHKDYDQNGQVTYNWGYDPQNYNAPETSFSSNPDDPGQAIRDLKTMIQAYHDAGISVTLDVVYNHIYSTFDSAFQSTVPDYYYRMNPNGSFQNGTGVGSETASEHEMFRKFMIDSLRYWVEEFNVDGFRFDLMGIHDVTTMNIIREEMDKIDPRILLYGEGWDMGTGLMPEDKAKKDNAYQLPRIGFFNDTQRDAVKGAEVYGGLKAGYVSGQATEDIIAKAILGSSELGSYLTPTQVLNYVEAHDNFNLHDLLVDLHPDDDEVIRTKRIELATAMNLLMQGMAFMELGQEFSRTKLVGTGEEGQVLPSDRDRAMNSYNAPDAVNQVNWELISQHQESIDYIKQIIRLKTSQKEFSYQTYEEIYKHVFVREAFTGSGIVIFEIKDEKHYEIIFNASGLPYYLENADHLRLLVGNSRHKRPFYVENLTASVFEVIA